MTLSRTFALVMVMCSSVRECFGSKPPMAVFSMSIVGFALTLVGVSLYFQSHKTQILNPDIKDWNSFFTTLSDMEVCFPSPQSPDEAVLRTRARRELASASLTTTTTSNSLLMATDARGNDTEANVTISILADVQVQRKGVSLEGLTLHSLVGAKFFGFKRDKSFLEVTIDLARQISKNWTACMTLSGPAHLLPNSPQTPPTCTPVKEPKTNEVFLAQPWLVLEEDEWCMNGTVGSLSVAPQHELNVYLTEGDVTLIQVHILYTTCLLCVMMIGLLFYFLCGKRCSTRTKAAPLPDKVPLNP